jgi:hypothetical protein
MIKGAKSKLEMSRRGILNLILTDLDKYKCPPSLIRDWFDIKEASLPEKLVFRVAIREIESWILADVIKFSGYFEVSKDNFREKPDEIRDPKQYIFNVIRAKGTKNQRDAMLPRACYAL